MHTNPPVVGQVTQMFLPSANRLVNHYFVLEAVGAEALFCFNIKHGHHATATACGGASAVLVNADITNSKFLKKLLSVSICVHLWTFLFFAFGKVFLSTDAHGCTRMIHFF